MLLSELEFTCDNPPGYAKDRFASQWLMPTIRHPDYEPPAELPQGVVRDLFECVESHDPDYLAHHYYKIVQRRPPHVRAGKWSVRCYSAMHERTLARELKFMEDPIEVACFIAHLTPVRKPSLWRRIKERIAEWLTK